MLKLILLILVVVVIGAFFTNTYVSSPGMVTPQGQMLFEETKQVCVGYSHLMNPTEVAADAPGKSLCIGFLK